MESEIGQFSDWTCQNEVLFLMESRFVVLHNLGVVVLGRRKTVSSGRLAGYLKTSTVSVCQ